uniref:Gag-like protein n=1 Tax=Phallusia mammillata TaxID=59560 RepID=A0A6F9DS22_9ASCI|nr:gag-like protein [Phallusia mammillata]
MEKGPSFAQVIQQRGGERLKRPTCMSFKTRSQSKREDVVNMIEKESFSIKKLVGISERKGNLVDVTCTTRKAVLELYEKLVQVDEVYSVRLYESDNLNVAVGWVPIPFPNEEIKKEFEKRYGDVKNIQHRKDKKGLLTGMRILTLDRADVEKNPIPSYVTMNGYEFYCTYNGQQITCKYCTKPGHKQQNCPERIKDYPKLETSQNVTAKGVDCPATDKSGNKGAGEDKSSDKPIGEPLDLDTADTFTKTGEIEISNTETRLPEPKEISKPPMELKQGSSRKRHERSPTEPNLHQAKSISLSELKIPISCPICDEDGYVTEKHTSFFCWKCSSEFNIATACCNELDRFLVPDKEVTTNCTICNQPMRKMPCCHKFQPEYQTDEGTFECLECERYAMFCVCKTVNAIPKRTMTTNCLNNYCKYTIVNCNCGKKTCQLLGPNKPYLCECGFEYEFDIEIGVERV